MTMPATGPSRTSTFRFIAPFMTPLLTGPSFFFCRLARHSFSGGGSRSGRGRGRRGCQTLALEFSHVGDDRPAVCRRDGPPVGGHQALAIRDDVEDLSVRVLDDGVLVEGGGGNAASLEQDALAVPPGVVTRLAVDRVALPPA